LRVRESGSYGGAEITADIEGVIDSRSGKTSQIIPLLMKQNFCKPNGSRRKNELENTLIACLLSRI